MEQAVWSYIGVIAALMGLLIVAQIFLLNQESVKQQEMQKALQALGARCDFVCLSDEGTLLNERVSLASGAVLSASNNSICYSLKGKTDCFQCKCVLQNYDLNLDTGDIEKLYSVHEFSCGLERRHAGVVSIGCRG